jgi:hypothetical protein
MKKALLFMFFASSVLLSCFDSKQDSIAPETPLSEGLRVMNTSPIDVRFKDFIDICKTTEFENIRKSISLDLGSMMLIKFDKVSNGSRAVLIPINTDTKTNVRKTLMIAFNNDLTQYRFLIIENDVVSDEKERFSGVNKIKTMQGETLIEEHFQDNKLTKSVAHNIAPTDIATKRNARADSTSCTYAEFNFYYQRLKSNCSNDAACDIACSFTGPICTAGIALQALDYCLAYDYNP